MIHGGVRWNTTIEATSGWISGTNWMAEAPVPTTATFLSVRSYSWSQRAEWKTLPWNRSIPGSWGIDGSDNAPTALTRMSAVIGPRLVSRHQRVVSASHVAPVTVVLRRMWRQRSR